MVIAATNNNQTLAKLAMNITTGLSPIRVRPSNLMRPLQLSAWHGHRGIVILLLHEYHPYQNLDFTKPENFNAFAIAARAGHEEIVILLLDKYRDAIVRHPNYFEIIKTALLEKNVFIAKLLFKWSSELNDLENHPGEIRELIERSGYEEILKRSIRSDPGGLHLAASEGDLQEVRQLLELGASIHLVSGDHWPLPQERANSHVSSTCWIKDQISNFLVQKGARVSASALKRALQEFDMPFVQQLTKWGAENSPLEQPFGGDDLRPVAGSNQAEIPGILILLMRGASSNSTTGVLALHEAVRRGCERNVKVLLESKAPVNARDEQNFTPLQLAAGLDRPDIFSDLLREGAYLKPSIVGTEKSALFIAMMYDKAPNLKLLLQWKARSIGEI